MWPFDKPEKEESLEICTSYKTPESDPTEEEAQSAKANIIKVNRVDEELNRLQVLDDIERVKAEDFVFEYDIRETPSGKLLVFGGVTINLNFLGAIEVGNLGKPPYSHVYESARSRHVDTYYSIDVYGATPSTIVITYTSGKEIRVVCNRHALEMVYAGLIKEWRNE